MAIAAALQEIQEKMLLLYLELSCYRRLKKLVIP